MRARVAAFLAALFGTFSWNRPEWARRRSDPGAPKVALGQRFGAWLKRRARPLLALAAVGAIGVGGYGWYATRPPPPCRLRLAATVRAPEPPPRRLRSEPMPKPEPLVVTFSGSAAPLDQINKVVAQGISLRPAAVGEWRWLNERALSFSPQAPWAIGQHYKVALEPSLVSRPNVELVTRELTFDTKPLTVELAGDEFYQDPVDPTVKQVVVSFRFNYPVDAASFEKRVELSTAPEGDPTRRTAHHVSVAYDDLRFEAYVRSESLPLPLENHVATLILRAGTKPEAEGRAFDQELTGTVSVPGKGNMFRVGKAEVSIARSAEGDPDQVLIFTCTSQVNEKKFADAVKAWVLPKDLPAVQGREGQRDFSWQGNETLVGPEVLKKSARLKLAAIPGERESGEVQSFKLDAKPGASLFVRVEAGVEAFGGYVLQKPFEVIATVPEYPRELRLAHEGSVLSVSGDKKLTVTARGLPAFKVRLFRIQPKDLNHLVTQTEGDFAHMAMPHGNFTEENVSEIFTEVRTLDATNPRVAQYAAVDFTPYLKEGGEQRGLYFVRVEAWNPVSQQPITQRSRSDERPPPSGAAAGEGYEAVDRGGGDHGEGEGEGEGGDYGERAVNGWGQLTDQRFVLLTDLGVIDKVDAQQNHWVFVQSFRTGLPVAGAQVEVLAKNGMVVLHRATDASGAATLPPLKDFTAEKTPVALVARNEGDTSFLPLNRSDRALDFSRFDVGGVRTQGKAAALTAFAFSDRGLYRPGETAHLATIVRAVDWSRSMQGVPLQLEVTDPRGLVAKRQKVVLDATGLSSIDFTPEERAATGTYTFTVSVAEEHKATVQLGSTPFRVEEFLPDRMRMNTRFEGAGAGWMTSAKLQALVELRNLFGTPAADHDVQGTFNLSPYSPSFSKYPDFQFFDPARAKRSEQQRLPDGKTDGEGNATFDIDLSSWAPATYLVSFYAEGLELGGGRSVSSAATVVVSPRKYLLGFKADGPLDFIKQGVARKVEIIAIDPLLKRVKVDGLKTALIEQRFVSVLTRESNGSYRYQSVQKDVTRKTDAFAAAEAGTTLALPSADVGTFYLSVRDADDVELLRVPYTIAGEANLAKNLERNAELKVSLDKPEYEPGETMTLQITAPYAGAGVITVERDRVYAHKSFKTTTSNTVQTLEVPTDLEANGYVNVAFVRSLDSPELYVSPLSYGVVPFKVLKKSQHLNLTLTAAGLSRPGRPLALKVRTDRPSKVVLFAVDEGILQVARYETPDPLAFFLARRALEVSTRQIVDLLLPEYRLVHGHGQEGGDEDAAALARNLNPFKRKSDPPAVFWSGILEAGPDERTVSFTVPESFNGSLRVMAVAAAPEALAAAHTSTTIRGPFVIAPNVPTFLSPKDRLTVTAAIANNVEGSGDSARVTVTLKPNASFVIEGSPTQELSIAEGREAVASFDVSATDALGDGTLQFLVSGAKQEAERTAHVSVRPASPYLVATSAGSVKDGKVELVPTRHLFDPLSTRELSVSLLPLGISAAAVEYLESYPHLCSEQLSSRAAPALVFMKRPEWGYDTLKAKAAFDRAFNILRARQNDEGGFGYWAANSFVSEPLDVYITLMLTEAKERGAMAPNDVRQKAVGRLKKLADQPTASLSAARLQAQALYVLARNEVVMPAPTAQLAGFLGRQGPEASTDVAFAYLAATYQLTNDPKRAQQLIERFTLSDRVAADPEAFYDDHVYRAQVLYLVAKHFPARLDAIGPKLLGLLAQSLNGGMHSLSAAWSLYALDAYATAVQGTTQGGLTHVTVEVKDGPGPWKAQALSGALVGKVRFDGATSALKVTAKDGPIVFYSLTESGFDRDPPATAIKEGLELIHSLEDGEGHEVTRAKLGAELTVRLRTRSLGVGTHLRNLAIVDLLPSGFEVVLSRGSDAQGLDRLVSAGATWRPNELDAREDRVIFYGDVDPDVRELKYRVKAVAKGTFVVPPAFASGMYAPELKARSTSTRVVVE